MVRTAAEYDEGPISFRYPRGDGVGIDLPERGLTFYRSAKAGLSVKGRRSHCSRLAPACKNVWLLRSELDAAGLSTTVADARFAKPLDEELIRRLAREHEVFVTVEEGAIGGFASHVLHFLSRDGLLDNGLRVRTLILPDLYLDHAKPEAMYARSGLDSAALCELSLAHLGTSTLFASSRVTLMRLDQLLVDKGPFYKPVPGARRHHTRHGASQRFCRSPSRRTKVSSRHVINAAVLAVMIPPVAAMSPHSVGRHLCCRPLS